MDPTTVPILAQATQTRGGRARWSLGLGLWSKVRSSHGLEAD